MSIRYLLSVRSGTWSTVRAIVSTSHHHVGVSVFKKKKKTFFCTTYHDTRENEQLPPRPPSVPGPAFTWPSAIGEHCYTLNLISPNYTVYTRARDARLFSIPRFSVASIGVGQVKSCCKLRRVA
uniref:Uncharacterized protein n=1 Tax=Rhipicephalus zambeziensis TaxID=60191 RepID=A0A224YHG7_9ACAR